MTDDQIKDTLREIVALSVKIFGSMPEDQPAGRKAALIHACGRIAGIAERAIENLDESG